MSTPEPDDVRRRQRAQQVALFRYQLICPALDPDLSTKARGRVVRALAARSHAGPFGGQQSYSRDTLDRWAEKQGEEKMEAYRAAKNERSIDGLPALGGENSGG